MDIQIAIARLGMVQSLSTAGALQARPAAPASATAGPSSVVSLSGAVPGADTGMDKLLAALENRQQLYSNQLGVLTAYRERIGQMGSAADKLVQAASAGDVKTAVLEFAEQYNRMVRDYAPHFATGGTFDQLDATEYARFAMEREVDNTFHGAGALGFAGLSRAGISIDPKTKQMNVDVGRLHQVLVSEDSALRSAVKDLAVGFKAATEVYTSDGKFLDNRMTRLKDALSWLDANLPGIRAGAGVADASAGQAYALQSINPATRSALKAYASAAAA